MTYITDDFSPRVRAIRKKIWASSERLRANGSVVKLRYDHAFIDKIRYTWDEASNALVRDRSHSDKLLRGVSSRHTTNSTADVMATHPGSSN